MRKEVSLILIIILLVPVSYGQINSIEIKDVNVNDNSIQVLVQNNLNQDFVKELFIINWNNKTLQEVELKAFEAKYFVVNYPFGVNLVNLQIIINDNTVSYLFTGNEDKFVINQEASQTISTTESNSPISYIYSGERLAKVQDNNIVYYSSDNVGSTSLETDSLGNINFKSNYLPFGKELSFSSIGKEKYGFTGKEYDAESSLNYFNARYYNPNNGKFISNDPIFKPSEGGYQYVRNNPLIITDPSGKGHCPGCDIPTIQEDKGYGINDDDYIKDKQTPELWDTVHYAGMGSPIWEKIDWSIETAVSIAGGVAFGLVYNKNRERISDFYGFSRSGMVKQPVRETFSIVSTTRALGEEELRKLFEEGRVNPRGKLAFNLNLRNLQIFRHGSNSFDSGFLKRSPFYSTSYNSFNYLQERRVFLIIFKPGMKGYDTGTLHQLPKSPYAGNYVMSQREGEFLLIGGYSLKDVIRIQKLEYVDYLPHIIDIEVPKNPTKSTMKE